MPASADRSAGLAALYQERILQHYRRPLHKGAVAHATGVHGEKNPLCGDNITVSVRVEDGAVAEAGFTGSGCSIMQATASMLTEFVRGRTVADIDALAHRFDAMLASGEADDQLGELTALAGVSAFPARHKCARLPWRALMGAVKGG
ncbi:MAG: SUF system NifU family Fe-S cluster assembly protein [Gemmatimonadaceae bacterium]|nr:SUF system NifU family Fe-S cluster assembly protein [Gemmatimonadaceae bacterium]